MLSIAVHFAGKCVKLSVSQCAVLSGDHTLWEGSWELCVCPAPGPGWAAGWRGPANYLLRNSGAG